MKKNIVFVAQLVEQPTLNQWAVGSTPSEDTLNFGFGIWDSDWMVG